MINDTAQTLAQQRKSRVKADRFVFLLQQDSIATQYEQVAVRLSLVLAETYEAMCYCVINNGYIPRAHELAAYLVISLPACRTRIGRLMDMGLIRRGVDGLLYLTGEYHG